MLSKISRFLALNWLQRWQLPARVDAWAPVHNFSAPSIFEWDGKWQHRRGHSYMRSKECGNVNMLMAVAQLNKKNSILLRTGNWNNIWVLLSRNRETLQYETIKKKISSHAVKTWHTWLECFKWPLACHLFYLCLGSLCWIFRKESLK